MKPFKVFVQEGETMNKYGHIHKTPDDHSKVTPKEFHHMLKHHDWYYQYSDDHRAWTKGREASEKHQEIAKQRPDLAHIHKAWIAHKNDVKNVPEPKEPD